MAKRLTQILEECRIMVSASITDKKVKEALVNFGYHEEFLQKGAQLYNETELLFKEQNQEKVEVRDAVDQFNEARQTAESRYKVVAKLAPVVLRNKKNGDNILPKTPMPLDYEGWKKNALNLYNNILQNPEIQSAYTVFGYTAEELTNLISHINFVDTLKTKRVIESGEAQVATQTRNIKFAELKAYCQDLRVVAKLAMANEPQMLEKLGILVRN